MDIVNCLYQSILETSSESKMFVLISSLTRDT